MNESEAWLSLAASVEPGDALTGRLLEDYSPHELVRRPQLLSAALAARLREVNVGKLIQQTSAAHSVFITRRDPHWPKGLMSLGVLAPVGLWVRGNLLAVTRPSMSMVGSRTCSVYGEETATTMASEFAHEGLVVVSGGAFGIDAASHRGALAVNGETIAILAGGVNQPYPRAHTNLFSAIEQHGCLVSESPPNATPLRHRFLVRNRMIAAWSRGTVVVEARVRSGAIATASHAAALGRDVMAIPGLVTSAASAGCHALIRDGAVLVTCAQEAIELVGGDLLNAID